MIGVPRREMLETALKILRNAGHRVEGPPQARCLDCGNIDDRELDDQSGDRPRIQN